MTKSLANAKFFVIVRSFFTGSPFGGTDAQGAWATPPEASLHFLSHGSGLMVGRLWSGD